MATVAKNARRRFRANDSHAGRNGIIVCLASNLEQFELPTWVVDHKSFRRWATSDDRPQHGRFSFLDGTFWVDLSMEQIKHNFIKGTYATRLTLLTDEEESGIYVGDNMLITNVKARLSTEPDGSFISYESLQRGRVVLKQGGESLEIQGSPDMTLEIVSPTSVEKDMVIMPRLYWRAGVREYWLVDPRAEDVTFDIHQRGSKGFVAVHKRGGWVKSEVFGRSFRLTQRMDKYGLPKYRLEVR